MRYLLLALILSACASPLERLKVVTPAAMDTHCAICAMTPGRECTYAQHPRGTVAACIQYWEF